MAPAGLPPGRVLAGDAALRWGGGRVGGFEAPDKLPRGCCVPAGSFSPFLVSVNSMFFDKKVNLFLGLFWLCISPFADAKYTSPVGIWDVSGTGTVVSVFPDHKSKTARSVKLYKFVQFKDDGSYTTIPWLATPGQWQALKPATRYRVSFDLSAIPSQTSPAFLNGMLSEFVALATKKYGQAPSVTDVQVTVFRDTGKLTSKGRRISGTNKMKALVTYTNPTTNQAETANVRMTLPYTGYRASAPSNCCTSDDAAQNEADSQAFLTANAKLPGIKTTEDGLQYEVLIPGAGDKPSASSKVTVYYRGILPNGKQFDSNFGGSKGATFSLTGVISGFSEGLQLMPKGAYYRLYLPPGLAYGATGSPPRIKPNSALIFDVQLVDFSNP